MAGRASSPSWASLGKAEGGASVSHRPLGLSGVLAGKKVADTIPSLKMGHPPSAPPLSPGMGTLWELDWSVQLPLGRTSKVL